MILYDVQFYELETNVAENVKKTRKKVSKERATIRVRSRVKKINKVLIQNIFFQLFKIKKLIKHTPQTPLVQHDEILN